MELNKKDKAQLKQWIKALRSGEYKQTKFSLQNSLGYCCLGVACKLFINEDEIVLKNGFIANDVPKYQPSAPNWLKDINVDYGNKNNGTRLGYLNDNLIYNFETIADCLELEYIYGEF